MLDPSVGRLSRFFIIRLFNIIVIIHNNITL